MRRHVTCIAKVDKAASWISDKLNRCSKHHTCYRTHTRPPRLPTRVLDLDPPGGVFDVQCHPISHSDSSAIECEYCNSKATATVQSRQKNQAPGALNSPVKLYVSNKDERAIYAALSHCWGASQHLTTENKIVGRRVQDLQEGICFGTLPLTYRHAVMVARQLGIRFLWIDSLCIVQDDADDWAREGAVMGRIYQQSYITIAATAGTDGTAGLFWKNKSAAVGDRIKATVCPRRPGASADAALEPCVGPIFARPVLTHDGFAGSGFEGAGGGPTPLITRGWVFQERALSPRVVHFCAAELVWECGELLACECGGAQNDDSMLGTVKQAPAMQGNTWKHTYGVLRMAREDVIRLKQHPALKRRRWRDMVGEYARLGLTYETDRLPALAGIASELFADVDRQRYLAGLWEDTLHLDLQWVISKPQETLPASHNLSSGESKDFVAPSWSWASKTKALPHYGILVHGDDEAKPAFELIAARCDPMNSAGNEFGRLKAGCHVVLRGDIAEVRLQLVALSAPDTGNSNGGPREVWTTISGELGAYARVFMDYKLSVDDPDLVEVNPPVNGSDLFGGQKKELVKTVSEVFYAVRITGKSALLLRRVGYDTDVYERVGLAFKLQTLVFTRPDAIFKLL